MNTQRRKSVIWKISDEELKKVVLASKNYQEILAHFGLKNKGGNSKTLKARLIESKIDFKSQGNKFSNRDVRLKTEDILVENSHFNRTTLKKRLVNEGLLEYKCEKCGIGDSWKNEKLSLVLDHKNGISDDNRIDNLRFLCPNCNSQTSTFAGKNARKNNIKLCLGCSKEIEQQSDRCKKCFYLYRKGMPKPHTRKVERPTREVLIQDFKELKYFTKVAEKYGMTDNAVRKWVKSMNITKEEINRNV